ncbi:MAG: hypothetical protein KC503_23190 [Myxococcales bacterium]|nr:hypothetical protein [Myxococcales bacterium]
MSSRVSRLLLLVVPLLAAGGCTDPSMPSSDAAAPGAAFYSPQGLAASARFIIVANSGYHFEAGAGAWDEGFVTFVDRRTRRVVGRAPTSAKNPTDIVVAGDRAYVVCSGPTVLGKGEAPVTVDGPGSVDIYDLSGAEPPSAPLASIALETSAADARVGAYGSIALSADGKTALIGSGTRGDVFKVDLEQRRVLRGADNPIALFETPSGLNGLTTLRRVGSKIAVLDYNSDQLCLSDDVAGDLAQRDCRDVGVNDSLIEGPIDIVAQDADHALVLMTIANGLYRVEQPLDRGAIESGFAATGLGANRVVVDGAYAYVVNSLSHALQRIELASKRGDQRFAVLPVRSNPFDMVVTDEVEGRVGWVTLFEGHGLALVELATGRVIETLGANSPRSDAGAGGDGAGDAGPASDADGAAADLELTCDSASADGDARDAGIVGIHNVVSVSYGPGAGHGQQALPAVIQGGPAGSGGGGAAVEGVLSLGDGGEIVVDFGPYDIVDGPGPDFIVFENVFALGPYQPYAEPGIVAVSESSSAAADFKPFSCDLTKTQGDPVAKLWPFPGCAGVKPVLVNRCIDPRDPALAGGDAFDLADVNLTRARYLRIRDAGKGKLGSETRGFDLDAVVLINYTRR